MFTFGNSSVSGSAMTGEELDNMQGNWAALGNMMAFERTGATASE